MSKTEMGSRRLKANRFAFDEEFEKATDRYIRREDTVSSSSSTPQEEQMLKRLCRPSGDTAARRSVRACRAEALPKRAHPQMGLSRLPPRKCHHAAGHRGSASISLPFHNLIVTPVQANHGALQPSRSHGSDGSNATANNHQPPRTGPQKQPRL